MKKLLLLGMLAFSGVAVWPQGIPDLPIAIGVGSAEVWGDSIYYFGGSDNWTGTIRYQTVYKYDGNSWQEYTSMPDNDVWGISSALRGDSAFIYGGYPNGTNKLRIFNFLDTTWVYAASSPSIGSSYGHTMECIQDSLYMFFNGYVYRYDIRSDTWSQRATFSKGASYLQSTVYMDEIYLTGWSAASFNKYNPVRDEWTPLTDLPYFITGGSLKAVDEKIYYVGGTSGFGGGTFNNTLVYDITANQWRDTSIVISADRAYMADVLYQNKFYVIGGLDKEGKAAANVELISTGLPTAVETTYGVLENFELSQNYPNPFSRITNIPYAVPSISQSGFEGSRVTLKIFDVLGNEVATLVNEAKPAGSYEIAFDASAFSPGVYFYKLKAGSLTATKKMYLIR